MGHLDSVYGDILAAWQRLFAVHRAHGLGLPQEVLFDKLPDIYNPLLRQSASSPEGPAAYIAYVYSDNVCLFREKKEMKAILEFTLPEEKEEFEMVSRASNMHAALWDVAQKVFRPARKHGYSNSTIQKLLEKADLDSDTNYGAGTELVSELEKLFYEILEEHKIDLG